MDTFNWYQSLACNKMDNSSSTYSREEFKELQDAFEALYEESIKLAKRNMELKDSLKKVTLEKEALEQRVVSMKNEVASLHEERKINTCLKEEITRTPSFTTKMRTSSCV